MHAERRIVAAAVANQCGHVCGASATKEGCLAKQVPKNDVAAHRKTAAGAAGRAAAAMAGVAGIGAARRATATTVARREGSFFDK